MKKIFLFLSAALLSLGVSATDYDVVINDFNYNPDMNNDIILNNFTDFEGNLLKAGDVLNISIVGYFSVEVAGAGYVGIVDNSDAAGNWKVLSEMNWEGNGTAFDGGKVSFGSESDFSTSIELTDDAVSNEKIIIRLKLRLSLAAQAEVKNSNEPLKLRPTLEEVSAVAVKYPVEMPTGEFEANGETQFKMEIDFETAEVLKKDDYLNLTINGTFSESVYHATVMVFEGSKEMLPWTQVSLTASKDAELNDVVVSIPMTNSFSGKTGKIILFVVFEEGESVPEGISFLKTGEEVHEGIELGPKSYETVSLNYNQYAEPHNYQFIDAAIATNVLPNDFVTFSISGVTNKAFEGELKVYLRDGVEGGSYGAISAYTTIATKVDAQGKITFEGTLKVTKAAKICDLVMEISDEATEGTSIVIAPEGANIHEAIELAEKSFTSLSLAANVWEGGSNYQYVEEITAPEEGFLKGDYVSFSVSGVASHDIAKLQVVLINDSYEGVSEYVTIAENVKEGDEINFTKKLALTGATDVCKLSVTTTDEAIEGVETITVTAKNVAVDEVASSAFAVVGGMVYSAGEIVVYNVAGKAIASAFQAFNVNSLAAGVYFITAKEGTIKFVK